MLKGTAKGHLADLEKDGYIKCVDRSGCKITYRVNPYRFPQPAEENREETFSEETEG